MGRYGPISLDCQKFLYKLPDLEPFRIGKAMGSVPDSESMVTAWSDALPRYSLTQN